jgi:spore germination protein YaaH
MRDYLVTFYPAERSDRGYYTVTFDFGERTVRHPVTASSLAALEARVRELAHEYGRTCSPSVSLAGKTDRKPAGFDKWCKTIDIIEYVPTLPAGTVRVTESLVAEPMYPAGWTEVDA